MYQYYLIYKPYQMLSQFSSELGKRTLSDFPFDFKKDIYPVGRLDEDSEGLLLLTNDKTVNNLLLNPKFQHKRTYWVQVDGSISTEALLKIEKGIEIKIDGQTYQTLHCSARLIEEPVAIPARNPPIRIRKNIPTSWIELCLIEGKNRQVRKMTAAVGFPTLRLIRAKIGTLSIEILNKENLIELSKSDIDQLLKND